MYNMILLYYKCKCPSWPPNTCYKIHPWEHIIMNSTTSIQTRQFISNPHHGNYSITLELVCLFMNDKIRSCSFMNEKKYLLYLLMSLDKKMIKKMIKKIKN